MTEPFRFRNPDGSLRLDELLGEKYVRHYTRILESSNEEFRAMQLTMAAQAAGPDVAEEYYQVWQDPRRGTTTPDGWLITAEGSGPAEASACTELALLPEVCWDVCGYYALLGVHWRATNKQIRLAYLEQDRLQENGQLHYAMTQLLDPVIRRAYDLMPLGGVFMGDRDVRERIEHAAAAEASRRNAEAYWAGEDYDETEQTKDVLREWGFEKVWSDEEARDRLTEPFRAGDDPGSLGSSRSVWERQWGFYRMDDPYDDQGYMPSPAVLERWQAMVAGALSALGRHVKFAVGIWPGNGPKTWHDSNECCIFFIGRGDITHGMAQEAAAGYAAQSQNRHGQIHSQRKRLVMPIMTEGAEDAERIEGEIKAARPAYFRPRQLSLKKGEQVALHFVTEINRLRSADVHGFIPTKPKPDGVKGDWSPKMWAICQNDRMFRNRDPQDAKKLLDSFEEPYGNCYIHAALAGVPDPTYGGDISRPTWTTFGLAVLREPMEDKTSHAITGFTDKLVEWSDDKGVKYKIPHFVVVGFRYEKLWAQAKATAFISHTICDSDFILSRKESDYNLGIVTPTPNLKPGTEAWKGYTDALDMIGLSLDGWMLDHASMDHYAYWFDPSRTPEGGYNRRRSNGDSSEGEDSQGSGGAAAIGAQPVDTSLMDSYRASLRNRGGNQ